MYKCIKEFWSFVYEIRDLEISLERKIEVGSEWKRIFGDTAYSNSWIRLRSVDGIFVLDVTEQEFMEYFMNKER